MVNYAKFSKTLNKNSSKLRLSNRNLSFLSIVFWKYVIYTHSVTGARCYIHPMLECAWGCGNYNLGSGCQQQSNNRSSKIYGSDFGSICYIHELRKKSGREFLKYISAHCLLCLHKLFDYLFPLDKSSILNNLISVVLITNILLCLKRC